MKKNKKEAMSETRDRLGTELREARKAKKMTIDQLAEKAGVNQTTIIRVEQGAYNTKIDTIADIAKALDLKIKLG